MTALQSAKFQVGEVYSTRSACDYDCVFSFEILSRTPATITTEIHGKVKRVGVKVCDGVEFAFPMGRYSMAPVIRASVS